MTVRQSLDAISAMEERTVLKTTAGKPHPLGASVTAQGVNFAVFSQNATRVWLELFSPWAPEDPVASIELSARQRFVWHCHVEGAGAGWRYVYRMDGPYEPRRGHRFNRSKVLMDPYAKALDGRYRGDFARHVGYDPSSARGDFSFDARDNADVAPRCVVVDDAFDWGDDVHPNLPLEELVIYETHVRGLTRHRSSRVTGPGTFGGAAQKIPYLLDLGINAVEFLPIAAKMDEPFLAERGLTNYWGYNPLGFFAPDSAFASRQDDPAAVVTEFKEMVRAFHAAGIEVILDVVFIHTAEGGRYGSTVSWRGIDNAVYYQLDPRDFSEYLDVTGCGNSLDFEHPQVVQLVMDAMRYWASEMHVDGFRLDQAAGLGRQGGRFNPWAPIFVAMYQDPVLSKVKLIAEPWDLGWAGDRAGAFPSNFAEWNGRFRDISRLFFRGDPGQAVRFAPRLVGSPDMFANGRSSAQSINYITCHDGMTLWDLVSYGQKHNLANQEGNRDGGRDFSCNHGAEGPSTDPRIRAARLRQAANLAAALLLSRGTPMILGGDEMLRTQEGNNNAYCQDSALSWYDWSLLEENEAHFAFVRALVALRRRICVTGEAPVDRGRDWEDEIFLGVDGKAPHWDDKGLRCFAYLRKKPSEELMLILSSEKTQRDFVLPGLPAGFEWRRAVDTAASPGRRVLLEGDYEPLLVEDRYTVRGPAVVALVSVKTDR